MENLNDFTIKQMIIASGFARKLKRREICRVSECTPSYLSRLLADGNFLQLINIFTNLSVDPDTKNYTGLGTLYTDIGRLLYSRGEKKIHAETKVV